MSFPCSTSSAEPCYGAPFFAVAGATARFAFSVSDEPTAAGKNLTGATLTLYVKGSITEADAAARLVATLGDGLTWTDVGLGAFIWDIAAATEWAGTAYTPGTPWYYVLRVEFADGEVYFPRGGAGEFWLERAPAGSAGCGAQVAWAPFATARAVGPNGSPSPLYASTAYVDAKVLGGVTESSATNATGNTTITVPAGSRVHSAKVAFTGPPGTRIVILDTANAAAGCVLRLDYMLPTTAGIVVELRDATAGGSLLWSITSGAQQQFSVAHADCVLRVGAWVLSRFSYDNVEAAFSAVVAPVLRTAALQFIDIGETELLENPDVLTASVIMMPAQSGTLALDGEIKTASFTPAIKRRYSIAASATITDPINPAPVNGDWFELLVLAGTLTTASAAYDTPGQLIIRARVGGAWVDYVK